MSQSKVTDFFNTRRRNLDLHPSKRRKINPSSDVGVDLAKAWGGSRARRGRSKDLKADLKIPALREGPQVQLPANAGDHTPEISAACDDHNGSPPSTPTKRASTGEKSIQAKRTRNAKTVRKDLLEDLTKTPEGYDFEQFAKSDKSKSARKKLILEPNDRVPMPESLSPKQVSPKQKAEATKKAETKAAAPNVEALRSQLSKSGKLADLQEKLAAYSDSVKKVKASRSKALKEILEKEKEERAKEESDLETVEKKEIKKEEKAVGTPKKNVTEAEKKEQKIGTPKKSEKTAKGKGTTAAKKEEAVEFAKQVLKAPEKEGKAKEPKATSKAPAYERFQHLVAPAPPSTLTLPVKFSVLGEMFTKADDVVRMLYNRAETCTFSKLRAAVQRMMHKNFEELHLGQIKTVMPESYTIRQETGLPTHGYQNLKRGAYQLTVEPIFEAEEANKSGRPSFTPDHQIRRKNIFYRALVAIVKKFHQEFLASLSMSLDDDKITHWHPRFKLNDIPDIEPAELPKPPEMKKLTTASEVLEQAKGTLNPRIQKALEMISGAEKKPETSSDTKPTTSKTPEKKGTSGISSSLLERIRAKERAKQEMVLTQSPANKERSDRISRLPELCQILRNIFIISKKPALPIEHAIQKISDSYKTSLGLMETEKHLDLMRELLPDWIQTLTIKKGTFIKVDKNKDIKDIIQKIESARKKLG